MTTRLVIFALALGSFAAAPRSLKAADGHALCPLGNATLRGTYMVQGTGFIVGVGPLASAGVITFDGKGNSVNTFSSSVNGTISRGATISGPYTVNSDCTGSGNLSGQNYDFVVSPDGSRVNWIATDPGNVFSGTEIRLEHSNGAGK